jgi:tRNA threonylcarbamoyladenosine biosynthesis protein TsaB
MLKGAGLSVKDCKAVAVSSGPGSYTGLRVGVSLAKGLCFGAGIPLIGVGTLDLVASQALELYQGERPDFIVPMIDARRMEVYQAVYDGSASRIGEIEPLILDGDSFKDLLAKGRVLFCGDGCEKFQTLVSSSNALFLPFRPEARYMAKIAGQKYLAGDFEDVAYMEPFYLKDFRIGQSKKNILSIEK